MKRPPDMQRLEEVLRSRKLSGAGFLGEDPRPPEEVIEADAAAVARFGRELQEIAQRMREITEAAKEGQDTAVRVGDHLEAWTTGVRGAMPCPWPHPGTYGKTVTTARRTDTGQTVRWSDLSVHMIEEHGFFEGKGSPFRIEPGELVEIIFPHENESQS